MKIKKAKQKRSVLKLKVPDLEKYIGCTVEIDGKKIKIETVVGNVGMTLGRRPEDQRPQYAEINGKYRLSFLRLFAQMNNETYTDEEYETFEQMQVWAEASRDDEPENYKKTAAKIVDEIMKKGKK